MYPISDLTAFCRKTTGDVPPKLVGASTTVVGSKMYLYGGRLVSERKMVSDIYVFDLESFKWERVPQSPEDDIPQARYFHSADTWRNHLIIFGGMAIKPQSDNPEDLCVLNDVRLFDLTTRHWLPAAPIPADSAIVPNARYAHLSSVTADRLFIVGGQDLANVWLDDVYIFDLVQKTWICRRDYPRHCGTYRSVAVTADQRVRLPQDELRGGQSSARLGQPGTRFNIDKKAGPAPHATQSDSLIHLPYSAAPTDEYPCDIFLFSNYNFTDVQRELEVFTPLSEGDFTVSDRSATMTGTSFPPGLRFPTGAILGTFFIVAGTYLSQTYQSFSIWALDLINMTWSRIDPGSALATGSWFRSCLWASANKFVVFGNRHGNLVEDYNRRLLSWEHVTYIDLEAFGIYQPPPLVLDISMQELGLGALEEGLMADFEIVCDDGRRIKVSRKLLEDRWPWFREQRKLFLQAASRALEAMPAIASHSPVPDVPTVNRQEARPDPRLTARSFNLSEPYPISLAFMQYFYSMALITPLQHAPAVLSQLLLLSSTYNLTHLQSLVKHAMHRALSFATSVGIYGVSTLCSCRSLQIRALRVVMAYSQKRPAGVRSKPDKDAGAGGGRNSDASGGSGGGRLDAPAAARPRGMSDASYMRGGLSDSSTSRGYTRNANGGFEPLSVLADLQEFGIAGQELPIPVLPGTSTKRFSDASMILPRVSEEEPENYMEFAGLAPAPDTSSGAPVRSPPPTIPLPTPPGQQLLQRPQRMGSLDTLAPLDGLGDRDVVPLKSLPVPRPRRMGSIDTISSYSSSRDARQEQRQGSPRQAPTPPPIQRPTSRPFSIMSQSTEQDLLAIAEMLSPSIDATIEEEPIPEAPPMPELESFADMYVEEPVPSNPVRDSPGSSMASLYASYQRDGRASVYTDSDGGSYMGDDMHDPSLLLPPLPHNHRNLHLPRGFLPVPALDDSRSVSSSTSYNSLRTPSLSRTPSLAYLASPPLSPGSTHSPIDAPNSPPHPPLPNGNSKMLGIIEESLHSEDHHHYRHAPDATSETVNLHDVLENEGTPATRNFPPSAFPSSAFNSPQADSYFDPRAAPRSSSRTEMRSPVNSVYKTESRSASRTEMRSPVHSLYQSDSRSDLRSDLRSPQRGEAMRADAQRSPPPQNPQPSRRLPELHRLQISTGVSSMSSAPTPDLNAPSPFGPRGSFGQQQMHSAHPTSHRSPLPFAPDQSRSPYGERRGGFIQDIQTPYSDDEVSFVKLRSPYSTEQLRYPTERTVTHSPSVPSLYSMTRSPTYIPNKLHEDKPQRQPPQEKLPLIPPVPLSPVPSMSSGSSVHTNKSGSKKGGFGKLFSRTSTSDKASKKSSDSSVHPSNQSVSSFDFGMSKDDAKRAKKEAAKARTERLAQDLAEKARKRADAAKAAKEGHVKEKSKRPWEEGGGLYEGISYF